MEPLMGVETVAKANVVVPHWFQCGSGSGSTIFTSMRVRIQEFWWPKIEIFLMKWILLSSKIHFSLGLHEGRPSILQPLKKNIQHIETWNFFTFFCFFGSFLPSWIRLQLIKIQDQCRSLRIRIRIHNTGEGYNNLQRKQPSRCPSVRYSSPSFLH